MPKKFLIPRLFSIQESQYEVPYQIEVWAPDHRCIDEVDSNTGFREVYMILVEKDKQFRDGLYKAYWPSGTIAAVGCYINGELSGRCYTYFQNGKPECEYFVRKGKHFFEDETWHENGQKSEEIHYDHTGTPHGASRRWWPSGQLKEEFTHVQGSRDGLYRRWHQNGQIAEEFAYKGGVAEGRYRQWAEDGILTQDAMCREGVQIQRYQKI
jgi:antitoxin component YwqK of YwqJK toxin-antitoxin module